MAIPFLLHDSPTMMPATPTIVSTAVESASTALSGFKVYGDSFHDILGSAPKLEMILEDNSFPFAPEAGVYIPSPESLFMSSNLFTDPATGEKTIKITKASVSEHPATAEIIHSTIPLPNGGVNNGDVILWTGQGTMNETGGLF